MNPQLLCGMRREEYRTSALGGDELARQVAVGAADGVAGAGDRRRIVANEATALRVADGVIYINGKPATSYTFKMDYYWMMGDNRDNSADSRYWGFVPEDHIVGTPVLILLSLEKDKGIFDGKIRWNRIFRLPNHDK